MNSPDPVHGLTAENLLQSFPVALQGDQASAALAEVTARLLARRPEETGRLLIYPAIDRLDEKLLDILAHDFKVDWWDPDYTAAEKRRTLKGSWYVHKHMGTKAAVETALRAVYPKAEVQEWFQYGGKPYFFKLNIDLTGEISDASRPWRVLERVNFYKSLRSHVDEIVFTFVFPPAMLQVGGGVGAQPSVGMPLQPDSCYFQDTVRVGGGFGVQPSIGTPLQQDAYGFKDTLQMGGAFGAQASVRVRDQPDEPRFAAPLHAGGAFAAGTALAVAEDASQPQAQTVLRTGGTLSGQAAQPVPEDTSQPSATTILRTGGVCTIISNISKGD